MTTTGCGWGPLWSSRIVNLSAKPGQAQDGRRRSGGCLLNGAWSPSPTLVPAEVFTTGGRTADDTGREVARQTATEIPSQPARRQFARGH